MLAWLLVITISTNTTISVPGIATESACEALAGRFKTVVTLPVPDHKCIDYRAAPTSF
jgi:hypothetical protein